MATLDVNKAINHLRSHKLGKSSGKCATYVKQALAAGGLPYIGGVDGFGVVDTYIKYGFNRVNVKINGKQIVGAVAGDICSIACRNRSPRFPTYNKNGEVYPGHATMFDGTQWISDYGQGKNAIPYSASNVKWVKVARWKDIPGDFNVPPDSNNSSPSGAQNADGTTENSGGNMGVSQVLIVENQYPTHEDFVTYFGTGGNIFENNKDNKITFTQATMNQKMAEDQLEGRTRIYSTNDNCIVLDELKIPLDVSSYAVYANQGITDADVSKRKEQLQQQEEQAQKKKQEEEQKKQKEKQEEQNKDSEKDKGKTESKDNKK